MLLALAQRSSLPPATHNVRYPLTKRQQDGNLSIRRTTDGPNNMRNTHCPTGLLPPPCLQGTTSSPQNRLDLPPTPIETAALRKKGTDRDAAALEKNPINPETRVTYHPDAIAFLTEAWIEPSNYAFGCDCCFLMMLCLKGAMDWFAPAKRGALCSRVLFHAKPMHSFMIVHFALLQTLNFPPSSPPNLCCCFMCCFKQNEHVLP